ncbi:unnamed protein product [Amoebophrya sp. A25]|nr:unnamed protein product [Amoebophrya sp. A25]|eukprot:GSA25T00000062001.1
MAAVLKNKLVWFLLTFSCADAAVYALRTRSYKYVRSPRTTELLSQGHGVKATKKGNDSAKHISKRDGLHVLSNNRDAGQSKHDKKKTKGGPMDRLGVETNAQPGRALQNIPGPAARLGLDVKPRPPYEEGESVKHYEYAAVPLDQRPPMKLRDIEGKVSPTFGIVKGVFAGIFLLIPLYAFYIYRNTEWGARNAAILLCGFAILGLGGFMLDRCGFVDAAWATFAKSWGEHWLQGVAAIPLSMVGFLFLADIVVRGRESFVGRFLSRIPVPSRLASAAFPGPRNKAHADLDHFEGIMANFL